MNKVLITGASGFVGSSIVKDLKKFYSLICIKKSNLKYSEKYSKKIKWLKIDLSKKGSFKNLPKNIEFIIHLAADPRTFLNDKDKSLQIKNNIEITNNLLAYSKIVNCKLFIYFSSAYVYSGNKQKKFKEDLALKPIETLGISKLKCERKIINFSKFTNTKYIILRLFTTYGKNARVTQFLPQLLKKFRNKKENKIILDNKFRKRDYIFIDDIVVLVKKILKYDINNYNKNINIFNLSSGKSISVEKLANLIKKILKSNKLLKYNNFYHKGNTDHISDNTKIKKFYKWKPTVTIEKGLRKIL